MESFCLPACINFSFFLTPKEQLSSFFQLGELKCEIDRCFHHDFDEDPMKAFDANKQFINLHTKALLIESVCEYFGMDDAGQVPTKHVAPKNKDEAKTWIQEHLGNIVEAFVFPAWFGQDNKKVSALWECELQTSRIRYKEVTLRNGKN